MKNFLLCFALATSLCAIALSEPTQPLSIDLTQPVPPVMSGHLKMGGTKSRGVEINVNNRYLTLDGKPWLPVMGEFHFSRYPRAQWEDELLKMKAGGIDIVSTYIFWIHHEEEEGKWDWSGDRNLRAFAQLCAKHGLYYFPRLGPWAHGEVRNGGLPDWLLKKCGKDVRKNAEPYMTCVRELYSQIEKQLRGLLWKDGGTVIGVQLENELTNDAAHILTLKNLARELGIDVPLYTMTGWMNAQVPVDEVLPMSGGYPDAFWIRDVTSWDRRSRRQYQFHLDRDDTTSGLDLIKTPGSGDAAKSVARNPFATCETGGGMQVSYTRRPVIAGDDIGALALVKVGSGSNLPGYYMYHGSANPMGKLSTLNESKATHYPNDLPEINYDFQAPLGEFGLRRESYDALRVLHMFVRDFGATLAPMTAVLPEQLPKNLDDSDTLRWSVRTDGTSGFIFINNYQRVEALPEKKDVQLQLKLKDGTLTIPDKPVTIPKNSYMIWPFNMDLHGVRLKYATAQLLCKIRDTFVFFAQDGIKPEFVFDPDTLADKSQERLHISRPLTVRAGNGHDAKILLLSQKQAMQAYKTVIWSGERLFLSNAGLTFDGETLRAQSLDPNDMGLLIYPQTPFLNCYPETNGVFTSISPTAKAKKIVVQFKRIKSASPAAPVKLDAKGGALQPEDADFDGAEVWQISIPKNALDGVHEVFLRIYYTGDVARAYIGDRLIDDDFYFGRTWEIGLKRFAPEVLEKGITLKILPLRKDAPVYIPKDRLPAFDKSGQAVGVSEVTAEAEYEVSVRPAEDKPAHR